MSSIHHIVIRKHIEQNARFCLLFSFRSVIKHNKIIFCSLVNISPLSLPVIAIFFFFISFFIALYPLIVIVDTNTITLNTHTQHPQQQQKDYSKQYCFLLRLADISLFVLNASILSFLIRRFLPTFITISFVNFLFRISTFILFTTNYCRFCLRPNTSSRRNER